MSLSANRLRLVEAFNGIRQLSVSVVGHSIGSTINVGFGATEPRRYTKRRTGNRRTGYSTLAKRDLLLASAAWELRGPNGYSLRSSDNPRRIAKEIELTIGKIVVGIQWRGFRQQAEIRFAGGATLRFRPDRSEDNGGWNFKVGGSYLFASGLIS